MDCVMDFFYSEKYCFYRNAAAILGTFFVGRLLLQELCGLVSGFRAFVLAPFGIGAANLCKHGRWAVVTGASEGIGRCYALELARRGLNVVLMSRSEEKLKKVAMEIKEKFGRHSLVIAVDFSDGLEIYDAISEQLSKLDIGVLVNNVGFSYEYPDKFGNVSAERMYKIVQINCQPLVQMTRILLPKMVSQGGGFIVNLSSMASFSSFPRITVYSATKIFVKFISDGLRKDYADKGLTVQTVTPFVVATKLSGVRRSSFLIRSPISYADAAMSTIGIQNNTYGCFSHALQAETAILAFAEENATKKLCLVGAVLSPGQLLPCPKWTVADLYQNICGSVLCNVTKSLKEAEAYPTWVQSTLAPRLGYIVTRLPGRVVDHLISKWCDQIRAVFLCRQAREKKN